ncbi:MAG: LamG domain-containing protein, partial [Ichthyobacteriaceae bacterium]|nr:LamG domain-containing protein [Ichthyobacteriaceae bacterium]
LGGEMKNFALEFTGDTTTVIMQADDHLNALNGAKDYTIEFWAFIPETIAKNDVLIKRKNQFAVTMYKNNADAGVIRRVYFTHYGDTSDKFRNTTDDVVNLGEWNHFAFISNSTTDVLTIYVNGIAVNDVDSPADALATPTAGDNDEFVIGFDGVTEDTGTNAIFDNLKMSTVARNIEDLSTSHVECPISVDDDTKVFINFDKGEGVEVINQINQAKGLIYSANPKWIEMNTSPF